MLASTPVVGIFHVKVQVSSVDGWIPRTFQAQQMSKFKTALKMTKSKNSAYDCTDLSRRVSVRLISSRAQTVLSTVAMVAK